MSFNGILKPNLAKIFKSLRLLLGLQQSEFGLILGVTQGAISKIEAGSMQCDLILYFKLSQMFSFLDPCCVEYGAVELLNYQFNQKGSNLAPSFDFENEPSIFEIKRIRPLYDYLEKKYPKELSIFLKENGIRSEIFCILNHPVTALFADSFFSFLNNVNITTKNLQLIDFNFDSAYGGNYKGLVALGPEDFINRIQNETNFLTFKSSGEKSYTASMKAQNKNLIGSLDNSNLIIFYNVIFPYCFFKKNRNSLNIEETLENQSWKVLSFA